jgi:hypothetical protein
MTKSLHPLKEKGFKATQSLHRFKKKGFQATQSLHYFKKKGFRVTQSLHHISRIVKGPKNRKITVFYGSRPPLTEINVQHQMEKK